MRFTTVFSTLMVSAVLAGTALANPNEAPEFKDEIAQQLGVSATTITEVKTSDEDLSRDGLTAHYYAGFTAGIKAPTDSFAEVDRGEGYVVVQKIQEMGDPIPVQGNVLGAYEDGKWQVQVNITDVQAAGGKSMKQISSGSTVVMHAGSDDFKAFIEARKDAMALGHTLKLAEIEQTAEQDRLKAELTRKKQAAEAEASAKAAEERRLFEAAQEAALIEERKKADEMLMALFSEEAKPTAQLSYGGRRVPGDIEVVRATDGIVEMKAVFDLGSGQTYQTPININLSPETGHLRLTIPKVEGWKGSRKTCAAQAEPNVIGGFVRFSNEQYSCQFELVLENLITQESET
jgi:hypothetical protein